MSPYFQKSYQRSFGTWPLKGDDMKKAFASAWEVGYRAFDTAQMYQNEADFGQIIKDQNIPRDEIFITTKVGVQNYSKDSFIPSVKRSLKELQIEAADVLLLHWPPEDGKIDTPLKLLEEAQKEGLTKHIGISNFTRAMMLRARDLIDTPIVTNQVEFHPLLNQEVLLETSRDTGIPLSSYCSVARGAIFKQPLLAEMGARYEKSAAQVALRWILQKGVSINTMSQNPDNIRANFNVMDFTLSTPDMSAIDTLSNLNQRIVTKEVMPIAPVWD